jgi:hypothetical protein
MALLRHAFADLGLFRVIGVTHPDNKASQRVLRKCGLVDEGWARYYGRRVRLFAAMRPGHSGRRGAAADPMVDLASFPALLQGHTARTPSRRRY